MHCSNWSCCTLSSQADIDMNISQSLLPRNNRCFVGCNESDSPTKKPLLKASVLSVIEYVSILLRYQELQLLAST